jgi:hypothetical protein
MKNTQLVGIAAILVVGLAATGILFADRPDWAGDCQGNCTEQQWKTDAMDAVSNNSFDAWKTAMISGLTVERFNSLVQKHLQRNQRKENTEAVQSALEAEDYAAWKAAVSALGGRYNVTEMVTEEEFGTLVEIYKAKESGNFSEARSLMEESGLNMIPGMELGMGYGQMKGGRNGGHNVHGCGMGLGREFDEE